MLTCICGHDFDYNMGNLKTYTMTLLTVLDFYNGRRIYANYNLNNEYIDYVHLDDIFDISYNLGRAKNSTFSLDELSNLFDCYEKPSNKNGTKAITNFAKETRKMSIKVNFTAQYFGQVNRSLRALTHKIIVTNKNQIINGKITPCYDDDATDNLIVGLQECKPFKDGLLPMGKIRYYPVIPDIFKVYDTTEKIFTLECQNDDIYSTSKGIIEEVIEEVKGL